jgi:arylsulfatase A-like enzyme
MGTTRPAFMVRSRRWKYVNYLDYPPQLFDLENDPEELNDLAGNPKYADVEATMRRRLEEICDPQGVDARARVRQSSLLEKNGGREAVIARGDLGFSPPPGVAAELG